MSGWIKLEKDRRDDPRVLRMARALRDASVTHERFTSQIHVTLVLGCLDVLWVYADTHIRDDDTLELGVDEIDELVGLKGFCALMPPDWLQVLDAQSVKLPSFQEHNGTESKRRALTQKRTKRYRNAIASQPKVSPSRTSVTPASPDLDQTKTKTRPNKSKRDAHAPARSRVCPKDWELTNELREWAHHYAPSIDVEIQTQLFREYEFERAWRDWDAVWRRWVMRVRKPNGGPHSIDLSWDPGPDPPELLEKPKSDDEDPPGASH